MNATKWLQQPYYGTDPNSGNALMAWGRSIGRANYIDNNGKPIELTGGRGSWVDDPTGPPINGTYPQRYVPDMTDPNNAIYNAGTMYGRGGINLWVPTAECVAIIAALRASPSPIPSEVLSPPPPAPPPAPPRSSWWAWLFRKPPPAPPRSPWREWLFRNRS